MPEESTDQANPNQETPRPEARRNISHMYANNIYIEPNIWDVKLFFGELDKSLSGKVMIDWRVFITMPWAQAKLLSYFLRINIAAHEQTMGCQIDVPASMLPALPKPREDNPADQQIHEVATRLYQELFGSEPKVSA